MKVFLIRGVIEDAGEKKNDGPLLSTFYSEISGVLMCVSIR